VIEVRGVNAGYGPLHVLFDIDVTFPARAVTCVLGPNGSGKSTLLKTVFGLTSLYSGEIRCDDCDLARLPPHEIARRGVAYLPQTNNIFENLKVSENLWLASYTVGNDSASDNVERVLSIFPILKDFMNKPAGLLSGGERQMLALGIPLIRRPRVIMLDEPTANLSPKMTKQLVANIKMLRDDLNLAVVLVEQNARLALDLSDLAYVMVSGKKVGEGEPEELTRRPDFNKILLGIGPS